MDKYVHITVVSDNYLFMPNNPSGHFNITCCLTSIENPIVETPTIATNTKTNSAKLIKQDFL